MCATRDRALLVEAEDIVRAGIPDARPARVPGGLMVVLPLVRADGDLTCLYLRARDGRLALADGGGLAPHLVASGLDMAAPATVAALRGFGLRCDFRTYDLVRDIAGLEGLVGDLMAMAESLDALARWTPASERLAA